MQTKGDSDLQVGSGRLMLMIHWQNPWLLLVLFGVPLGYFWQRHALAHQKRLPFSTLQTLHTQQNFRSWLAQRYRYGYLLVGLLVALALPGPQRVLDRWPVWDKGADVVFVLDLSESMLARDLQPSRIVAAQRLLQTILKTKRQRNDRFGLVIFASKAYTLCPLTTDHLMLQEMLREVRAGQIGNKTAMGDALATALARLRFQPQRRRAILLITDGETNAGRIHPIRAALRSRQMNIPIHALLMGRITAEDRRKSAPAVPSSWQPGQPLPLATTPWKALQQVAQISRGRAHRITKDATLQARFQAMLKSMFPARTKRPRYVAVYQDLFAWLLWPALGLLGLLLLLEWTVFRGIP
ncbi:MAG: VWA domain-containing protein [Deltaproteobacteria bacterium]|nr:MAG: VWA domain-containing protein [Deltaproteobacteria bacterium]